MSRERIRQIEMAATRKLKAFVLQKMQEADAAEAEASRAWVSPSIGKGQRPAVAA